MDEEPRSRELGLLTNYYTAEQLAKELEVSVGVLSKWRSTGEGPAFYNTGRNGIRYPYSCVDEWLAKRVKTQLNRTPRTTAATWIPRKGQDSARSLTKFPVPESTPKRRGFHRFGKHDTKHEKAPTG